MKDKYKLSKRMDETMTEIRELFEKLYKTMDEMRDMLDIPTDKKTKEYFKYTVILSNKGECLDLVDNGRVKDNGGIKIMIDGRQKVIYNNTFVFYSTKQYEANALFEKFAGTRGIIGIEEQQIPSKE